jgi:hypothetical protein
MRGKRFVGIGVAAGATSAVVLFVLAGTAAGSRWTVQPGPRDVMLTSVSCANARECMAVGSTSAPPADSNTAVAIEWNGESWKPVSVPSPLHGSNGSFLNGVACRGASCVAVGNYQRNLNVRALAEEWNGKRWKIQESPTPTVQSGFAVSLSKVSCPSAMLCVAAGGFGPFDGALLPGTTPLIENSANGRWSIQTVAPVPFDLNTGYLSDVSCPSTTDCVAVGATPLIGTMVLRPGTVAVPFAELWNGHRWTMQTLPSPAGATNVGISGISCSSTNACTAVGNYGTGPLTSYPALTNAFADRWNGNTWTIQAVANPHGGRSANLYALSCPASRSCLAVGEAVGPNNHSRALAERWNGVAWTIQPLAKAKLAYSGLTSVSCTSTTSCVAVGQYAGGSFIERDA